LTRYINTFTTTGNAVSARKITETYTLQHGFTCNFTHPTAKKLGAFNNIQFIAYDKSTRYS